MSSAMNSVLITGSAGFIGTHLAESYLIKGYQVIGMDNYITGSPENTNYLTEKYLNQFKFIKHDVSKEWPSINIENLKFVFHLACPASVKSYQKYPLETMWANSLGLKQAIKFADAGKARLIYSSTSEIYGSPLVTPQKESDWGSVNSFGERSCYDESKRFGEALLFSSNKMNLTGHGLVRIFNTYGTKMNTNDDRVPNAFIKNALKNEDLVVYGNGLQTRSFCYIDDLIVGLDCYADSKLSTPVNLGNDTEFTVLALAKKIIELTKSTSKIIFKDLPADDPPQRRPDLSLAKMHLNYSAKISLEEGIKKILASK